MNIRLDGKTAVVTGSTAGIGLAIARGLAASGADVVVNGRTEERVRAAIAEITAADPSARLTGVAADLATADGAAALAGRVPSADILVNNVGTAALVPFLELGDAEWIDLFQLNVMSGVRMTRSYLPGMVARGWGRVVFISSESALNVPSDMIHYGTTKTAQLAVSRGVAESVAGTGVTVNAVLAGPTSSELIANWFEPVVKERGKTLEEVQHDFLAEHRPTSLIERFATTDEVANMVVYVCSEQASATSGAALRVDGGVVRTIA